MIIIIGLHVNVLMQQSPSWKANGSSATHEMSHILSQPETHYLVQKSLILVPPSKPQTSNPVPLKSILT